VQGASAWTSTRLASGSDPLDIARYGSDIAYTAANSSDSQISVLFT
jgi:hypothetical protein